MCIELREKNFNVRRCRFRQMMKTLMMIDKRPCSGSVIGAGSVVVKPVTVKGIYAGNPARLIRAL